MNQPKFKFGDKVKDKDHGEIFDVEAVIFRDDRFMYLPKQDSVLYQAHFDGGFWEADLEIYQEPQKKKLYAYESGTWVCFSSVDFEPNCRRLPEYDIEYPETVLK